ncbi:SRPBCC domain-containing protein [Roseibium sp. MMSF_3412]|uniref:SRPBCC family protein n=1 Tax=Roseibium sp. MMSF_3412 TaxID=3046712 RepID=UPI00273D3CBC|nr:SRPBCC domain-containing protein [Roseibium sp. MMSF_3412]
MTATTITKTIFLNAPRTHVWAFLTEKDKLARWFHPAVEDLKEGADYTLLDQHGDMERICWGKVLEMKPHERLVYTFTVKPLNGAMTTVRWLLEDAVGGTRLTLVHEGIEQAAGEAAFMMLSALDAGWDEHFGRFRVQVREAVPAE